MNPVSQMVNVLVFMIVPLALWLGLLFLVVGLLWLMVRKLNRLERTLREVASKQGLPPPDSSDRIFVRRLVLSYFGVLVAVATIFGALTLSQASHTFEGKEILEPMKMSPLP